MRSDFYYWLTTVVIVTVLFGLFIEFLWTTAKVPDIVCRIPDSGYYRISQILPDNPALPDIRYIPSHDKVSKRDYSLINLVWRITRF